MALVSYITYNKKGKRVMKIEGIVALATGGASGVFCSAAQRLVNLVRTVIAQHAKLSGQIKLVLVTGYDSSVGSC